MALYIQASDLGTGNLTGSGVVGLFRICSIVLVASSLSACLTMNSGPDLALVSSCKAAVEDASKSLKQAESRGQTMAPAYHQSYKLVTQAKVHLKFEKYSYCLNKASRAQQYLGKLLAKSP